MIKNMMGEMLEFDMESARKLDIKVAQWIADNMWKHDCEPLGELVFTTWGYASALDEIEYLRKQIEDLKDRYYSDLRK